MALSPLAIGLIAAGGIGRGVGAAGQAIAQGQATFGKEQQARLAELRRLEEMRALGLTMEEEQALQEQILAPQQAAAREQFNRNQALAASSGVLDSGQAFNQLIQKQERADKQLADAQGKIAQLDLQAKQLQEQEMRALEQASDVRDAARTAAIFGFIGAGVGGAADIAQGALLQQELTAIRGQQEALTNLTAQQLKMMEDF